MERLKRETAAVVVIDVQNDFCHPQGFQARLGRDVTRTSPAITRLDAFLRNARELHVPVVFMQNFHDASTDTDAWDARHLEPRSEQCCVPGSWGADFYGTLPEPGDYVLEKTRYNAFTKTNLEDLLRSQSLSSLFFCGVATSVCVETSLRDAVCRDFLATLVEDCCGDYSPAPHAATVASVTRGFGAVMTSGEVLDGLRAG